MRARELLRHNIRALLAGRGIDQHDLAFWCSKTDAWLTKILNGERTIKIDDMQEMADFFGLSLPELLSPGISPLTERRRSVDRRRQTDRRSGKDRRQTNIRARAGI